MILANRDRHKAVSVAGANGQLNELGRVRLARELFCGGYRPGQRVGLRDFATKYGLDNKEILKIFTEFQSLGFLKLSGNFSAGCTRRAPKRCRKQTRSGPR